MVKKPVPKGEEELIFSDFLACVCDLVEGDGEERVETVSREMPTRCQVSTQEFCL